MRRREVLALLGGALASVSASRAQGAPPRIAFLTGGYEGSASSNGYLAEIREGLSLNGLSESRDYVLEARFASGRYEQFPMIAQDLVASGVKILLPSTVAAVKAAQRAMPAVPIVMVAINDPVGTGIIDSLSRPGGQTTGVSTLIEDITPKMLEFQRRLLPGAKKLGIIANPNNPTNGSMRSQMAALAADMGLTTIIVELRFPEDLPKVFETLTEARPDAIQLLADISNIDLSDRVAAFANARAIPLFAPYPPVASFGGLVGYGPPRRSMTIRTGYYVKRILAGAKPADLPVEQPTEIVLSVNLRTARALGLTVPTELVQLADEVIE